MTDQYLYLLILINLVAVYFDFRKKVIPNFLIGIGWVMGIISQVASYGSSGVLFFLFGGIIPIIILFVLFVFKMLGAGDIKLLSVAGGFLGARGALICIVLSFIIGAVLAAVRISINHNLFSRLHYLAEYFKVIFLTKEIKPYYQAGENDNNVIHMSVGILGGLICYMGVFN